MKVTPLPLKLRVLEGELEKFELSLGDESCEPLKPEISSRWVASPVLETDGIRVNVIDLQSKEVSAQLWLASAKQVSTRLTENTLTVADNLSRAIALICVATVRYVTFIFRQATKAQTQNVRPVHDKDCYVDLRLGVRRGNSFEYNTSTISKTKPLFSGDNSLNLESSCASSDLTPGSTSPTARKNTSTGGTPRPYANDLSATPVGFSAGLFSILLT
jgi:hypothetical protein